RRPSWNGTAPNRCARAGTDSCRFRSARPVTPRHRSGSVSTVPGAASEAPMNTKVQLRVLYRQFLFRLMDVELLSTSARGDSNVLLGQVGGLLIFGSVLLSWGAISVGNALRRGGLAGPVWSAERFLISLTMLMVGMFALVSWDSAFPDRRDVLVLGPLPVRG